MKYLIAMLIISMFLVSGCGKTFDETVTKDDPEPIPSTSLSIANLDNLQILKTPTNNIVIVSGNNICNKEISIIIYSYIMDNQKVYFLNNVVSQNINENIEHDAIELYDVEYFSISIKEDGKNPSEPITKKSI